MLVGARMSHPVITIGPRATLKSAMELIEKESVHSLPVTDRQSRLLGIITKDQIKAALGPNEVNEKSESELPCVEDIMTREVLTVTEDTPIEEAARIISDYGIRSIPVVEDGNYVVGIITSTSLIQIFLELTGARSKGVRVTFLVEDKPGRYMDIFAKIFELNGNIETFSTYCSEEKGYTMLTLKVQGIEKYLLKQSIDPLAKEVIDIR